MNKRERMTLTVDAAGEDRKSPIFIGGTGRSGTSLLRTILNAHPRIAIGTELKVTPIIAQFWHQLSQYQGHLGEHFLIEQSEINAAFGDLVTSLLDNFHENSGKPRIGEKTPNNVFSFPSCIKCFPKVRSSTSYVTGAMWCGRCFVTIGNPERMESPWQSRTILGRRPRTGERPSRPDGVPLRDQPCHADATWRSGTRIS